MFRIIFIISLLMTAVAAAHFKNSLEDRKAKMFDYLFPNRTKTLHMVDHNHRRLQINKPTYDKNSTVCIVCRGLKYCNVLNQKYVQEVYYPNNPEFLESCNVIESLGKRMYGEIFGVGKTFRDTPQCRDIVMQYLCLFYGSDNGMYKNYCQRRENDDIPTNAPEQVFAPRSPCRSFCVQVASVCANEMDFIQTCYEIACPQTDGLCISDPLINNSPLDAKLICSVPYYKDPYAPKAAAPGGIKTFHSTELFVSVLIGLVMWFMYI